MSSSSILTFKNVYLNKEGRSVLNNVSTELPSAVNCLCGPNGAGKTMLLKLALGFEKPASGEVVLMGGFPEQTRRRVGYVPQQKAFNRVFPGHVDEFIAANGSSGWAFCLSKEERRRIATLLEELGGLALERRLLRDLSSGEWQRVFLAKALFKKPSLLVLDEPLAGVDEQGRSQLLGTLLKLREKASLPILMVTHSEQLVRKIADHVLILAHGKVFDQGPAGDVLQRNAALGTKGMFGPDHEHSVTCESSDEG